MRILFDTNIFIYREDHSIIGEYLQNLLSIISSLGITILIHPLSREEIKNDKDQNRREIILSKINAYPVLENPPDFHADQDFIKIIGEPRNAHDHIDDCILYSIYKNAADFLVTEDNKLLNNANKLNIQQRIFSIKEATNYLKTNLIEEPKQPPALKNLPVHNLNQNDPIFDTLKIDYPNFEKWWQKISREGRKAWVYFDAEQRIGAILIYKIEEEAIPSEPPIIANRRIKISTMKVSQTGYKIGELFIKLTVQLAVLNNIFEIYLTHFMQAHEDFLVELIKEYGFQPVADKNGEKVFLKALIPPKKDLDPLEISKTFYPSLHHGSNLKKFIIPIKPEYHQRLFSDYQSKKSPKHQLKLFEEELITEGNTIRKAYLCKAKTKQIGPGDIIYFYRSKDLMALTSVGVVEQVHYDLTDAEEIMRLIGKRSVYTNNEIIEISNKPTTVIIFLHHFYFTNNIALSELVKRNVIAGAPQSICQIPDENSLSILKMGGIDERFIIC